MKALTWQGKGKITCETVPDQRIERGRDVVISDRTTNLEDGTGLYEKFRDKKDGCTKVVIPPHG